MQLAEAFAWCMLQVSLFTLVIACVYLAARRTRWGGGAALLLAGLCVVGLLTVLSVSPWPRWSTLDSGGINPGSGIAGNDVNVRDAEALSNPVRASARDMESPAFSAPTLERAATGNSAIDRVFPDATLLTTANSAEPGSPQPKAASPRLSRTASWWIVGVCVAWTAAAIGFVRFLMAALALWRLRSSSVAIEDPSLSTVFAELSGQIELKRRVRLRESASLGVAATCGWRRPVILLPAAWRKWTPDERRAVLAHELAHVRQGHFPKWFCAQLAVVAHFYHPIVHWLARQLRFEQELAADRLAAHVFGDRTGYARALAALALGAAPPSGAVASLGLFMSKPFLMRRLAMLRQRTHPTKNHRRVKRILALSLVLLAGIAVAGVRGGQPPTADEAASPAANAPQATAPAESKSTPQQSSLAAVSFVAASAPECYATALFRVSREQARLMGGSSSQSDAAWEVFCKTQIALLNSYFVLQTAVRDPEVAALPLLASADDPVGFLAQRLQVGFHPGSEILFVRMGCSRGDEADQAVKIVNAVAKAYEEEVVFKDRQRQLTSTDLLARNMKKLQDEIRTKMEDYQAIVREIGFAESGAGQVAQQLDIRRLERIEEELMRLENDFVELQTSGKTGNVKFFEERIAQLSKRRDDLEKRIMERSQSSIDLSERRRELEQLQRMADDMSTKLGLMEIEAGAPQRIELIQPAVVTDEAPSPKPTPAK